MFIVSREEVYDIKILTNKEYKYIEQYHKKFLDNSFWPILNFIEKKGLCIKVPTLLCGWDASFIYRKLNEPSCPKNKAIDELSLFIYMRLKEKNPISIKYSGLFVDL